MSNFIGINSIDKLLRIAMSSVEDITAQNFIEAIDYAMKQYSVPATTALQSIENISEDVIQGASNITNLLYALIDIVQNRKSTGLSPETLRKKVQDCLDTVFEFEQDLVARGVVKSGNSPLSDIYGKLMIAVDNLKGYIANMFKSKFQTITQNSNSLVMLENQWNSLPDAIKGELVQVSEKPLIYRYKNYNIQFNILSNSEIKFVTMDAARNILSRSNLITLIQDIDKLSTGKPSTTTVPNKNQVVNTKSPATVQPATAVKPQQAPTAVKPQQTTNTPEPVQEQKMSPDLKDVIDHVLKDSMPALKTKMRRNLDVQKSNGVNVYKADQIIPFYTAYAVEVLNRSLKNNKVLDRVTKSQIESWANQYVTKYYNEFIKSNPPPANMTKG